MNMTKTRSTKSALLASVIALLICCSMLVGTTFAWFTDSASSNGNKIVTGSLKIDLELLDEEDGWDSIKESKAPIFTYDNWEPGYTDLKILKVENEGSLALKWKAKLVAAEALSDLASVIDVYVCLSDTELTYPADRSLTGYTKQGTLAEFVNEIEEVISGELQKEGVQYIGLAFQMQTSAGNEFQEMELGAFDIQILAAQLASEDDSFDNQYDADANYVTSASTMEEFFNALEQGDDILLDQPLVVNAAFVEYVNSRYPDTTFALGDDTTVIDKDVVINGNGSTVYRTEAMKDKAIITVEAGYTLTLADITLDGGAVWTGAKNPVLLRGTVNSGIVTSGALVAIGANAALVLEEGAILQNNDGANAVSLGTRVGSTLTINGGEIINNHSAAGAIWGGGAITMNAGKVNGNHGGIGGAIRAVTNIGTLLTMNGGEMNHNYSDGNGGAIWAGSSRSNNVYVLNGGEMAYNYSATTGGAIYAGYYETVKIGGSFKMHDNSCEANIGSAIRFHDHASFVMTGGEIYNHDENALFLNNNSASITGGKIEGVFGYSGGLGLTMGNAEIDGVINYSLATTHNTAYLAAEFNGFAFTVNESAANFAQFNFKPAAGYTYTEGDEDKLVCLNEGYSTYWDAATGTFRLQAD